VPDHRCLRRKNAHARRTGAHVYIVTQFTFSADPIVAWERARRDDIARLPVTVGLPGLASTKTTTSAFEWPEAAFKKGARPLFTV
jgi:5,10-methylenetetrahydrofolate reductase